MKKNDDDPVHPQVAETNNTPTAENTIADQQLLPRTTRANSTDIKIYMKFHVVPHVVPLHMGPLSYRVFIFEF